VNVNITSNMRAIAAEVIGEYPKVVRQAAARALNRAATTVRKEASQEIRKVYAVSSSGIKSRLGIAKASPSRLLAIVSATGRPLSLARFKPRVRRTGISVEIKRGQRKFIKGAFQIPGRPGVWMRVEDLKSRRPRQKRVRKTGSDLPIAFLTTVSIPSAFTNDTVFAALERVGFAAFEKNFRAELAFRFGGGR